MDRAVERRTELQDPRVDQTGGASRDEDTEGLGGQRIQQQDREQDGRKVHQGQPAQDRDLPVGQGEPGQDEGVDVGGPAVAEGHEQAGRAQTGQEGWGQDEPEGLGADDGMVEPDHQGGDPSNTGDQQERRATNDEMAATRRDA